jgi:hypothetical protein
MTVRPGASYPPRTGVVPGVFLGGRMATGAGRVLLSWLAVHYPRTFSTDLINLICKKE